ncbi:MAG: M81 family metallopeptidase [Planctomycetota bacterium]
MKRVGIIALLHESNTFLDIPTTLEHFSTNLLVEGPDVLKAFRDTVHEVGGMISAIETAPDTELIGIFAARAMPYGTITADCWSMLMTRLEQALAVSPSLDGLLVAPHGATVATTARDADGDWLRRVRMMVGPRVPMIGTLDLHANVSQLMVEQCQALIGYRTNPHLDQFARGQEAGIMMLRTLRNEIDPRLAMVSLPLCVNIERQATGEIHGHQLWAEADRLQQLPGMLNVSCLYGFPYADVTEMGATVLAVSEWDEALANRVANEMARFWWNRREQFAGQLIGLSEAVAMACQRRLVDSSRPVGLLEMGDNVGGGSPGDGTWITHEWLKSGTGRILTVLYDPEAVSRTSSMTPGSILQTSVGGKCDPERHGPPIHDEFRIIRRSNGQFSEPEVRHGGYSRFDQGATVVLESEQLTAIVTSRRVAPMSLQQVISQGVNPLDFAAIVIKGVHAPVAAYSPVCSQLIRVNTRGATSADLLEFDFQHRRLPMVPFERM